MAKRYAEGLETVARALAAAEQTGVPWSNARVHQLHAELLLHAYGRGDEAIEASLRTAIAIAQVQSARSWELKATTLLARLCADQGKRTEARDLLVVPIRRSSPPPLSQRAVRQRIRRYQTSDSIH
jgi:hypothetical protein